MIMTPTNKKVEAVVIDASIAVAVSAQEQDKDPLARAAIALYSQQECLFFAPGTIITESLYVFCKQVEKGKLTPEAHKMAVNKLAEMLAPMLSPSQGEMILVKRAEEIRGTYSCRRSADGIYIALAEPLAQTYETVLLTFDADMPKQASHHAPTVTVRLLSAASVAPKMPL